MNVELLESKPEATIHGIEEVACYLIQGVLGKPVRVGQESSKRGKSRVILDGMS